MTKWEFLRVLGVGGAALIARPWAARAERNRILGGGGPEPPATAVPASPELRRLLVSIRVGERRAHGLLQVFWLHGAPAALPFPIATLDEARGRGDLVISERGEATLPTLVVDNRGKVHVLLLAGEILLGGKQNRVVNEDILLPPLSGPVDIGVYCVEQGRWSGSGGTFDARGTFAAPKVRARAAERSGQQRVWAEVDQYAARAAAPSPTHGYLALYDKPEVQAHQAEVERTIDLHSAPGALGAVVFGGDKMGALDLFGDAGLFAREWPKLLRAHAVETYGREPGKDPSEGALRARIQDLLRQAVGASGTTRGNPGVGTLFEFRLLPRRGAALVAEARVVHLAIL